ncbi:hypothetical protein C3E97_005130 [Pseudomonas sp. MWU12-2115]|nr:hypothetical protein C3E97_005130 [Pseudomonas sp. MWU12-2115]
MQLLRQLRKFVDCKIVFASKLAPTGECIRNVGASLLAKAVVQPPMIFMTVAPPENATSCLSPNALTSRRCNAGSA